MSSASELLDGHPGHFQRVIWMSKHVYQVDRVSSDAIQKSSEFWGMWDAGFPAIFDSRSVLPLE